MSHNCQGKKQPPGTNCQRHQPHGQDNHQIMNPVQTHDEMYLTYALSVRTHDEALLSITPQCNSHARTLYPQQFHASKPWTLVSAPSAIPARTFEILSLHHNPPWLILLAWIQSTGQRSSHDLWSCDLHSFCPNFASIMTSTKGISAYQVTDLPAILLWLLTLSFSFFWRHMHVYQCSNVFFVIFFLLFHARSWWAPRRDCNNQFLGLFDGLFGLLAGFLYPLELVCYWWGCGDMGQLVYAWKVSHDEFKWCFLCGGIWPGVVGILCQR